MEDKAVVSLHEEAYPTNQRLVRATKHMKRISGVDGDKLSQMVEMPIPNGRIGVLYFIRNYEDICMYDTVSGRYIDAATDISDTVIETVRDGDDFYVRDCVMINGHRATDKDFVTRLGAAEEILHRNYKGVPSGFQTVRLTDRTHMWYQMGQYRICTIPIGTVGTFPKPTMYIALNGTRDLYVDK